MNSIYITDLEIYAYHGVLPQENVVGNTYYVSLRLDCDLTDAMMSDDVEVYRIKSSLISKFPQVVSGMVKVAKMTPPIAGAKALEVAVSVEF